MPQNMFVVEPGHKEVNCYQNPPCSFVGSPSGAQGGATTSSLEQRATQKSFVLPTCSAHWESDVAWF